MNSATVISVVDVPKESNESNESNLLELIEQRFRTLLQCNKDIVLLSPNNSWLNAYRFPYHQDVELLKETLGKSKHSAFITMKDAGDRMKLDVTDNAIYITVNNNRNNIKLWKEEGEVNIFAGKKYPDDYGITFCFFSDGHIMQESSRRQGYIPATLKNIVSKAEGSTFFFLFIQAYFEVMSERYPVCKDLLRDFCSDTANLYVPISMNAIIDGSWWSYQMIFQNYYKLGYKVPKRVNSMILHEAYLKVKACKYVNQNEIQKIMLLPLPEEVYRYSNERRLFFEYYRSLIEKPCKSVRLSQLEDDEKEIILEDYIKMAMKVEKKVSLTMRSFRAIVEKHNKLIDPYMRKERAKKMVIPKDSPYRKLKLPKNYAMIETGLQLYKEGESMNHCVYSYREDVNCGKCVIVHVDFDGKPYTAEIRIKGKKKRSFYCAQLHGPYNSSAPKELRAEVNNVLQQNQSILEK